MAYYLTYQTGKNNYKPLDITKSKYFSRLSNFVGNACSIQEIDLFTTQFKNDFELKNALLEEGIIFIDILNKKITLRNYMNGKYNKVMYGLLYHDSVNYILNPDKLLEEINNRLLNEDFVFLEKYGNAFLRHYDCSKEAFELVVYAKKCIREGMNYKLLQLDMNGNNLLIRMSKRLIYENYEENDGYISYKDKIKYRNLHSIIAFMNNYDYTLVNKENDANVNLNVKVKRKTNNIQIDGQYSLFDYKK